MSDVQDIDTISETLSTGDSNRRSVLRQILDFFRGLNLELVNRILDYRNLVFVLCLRS